MYRFIIVAFLACARAQLDLNGSCEFTNLVTNLNITQLQGEWFQIARIGNSLESGQCASITIGPATLPILAVFENRQVVNKAVVSVTGNVTLVNLGGVFQLTYPGLTFNAVIQATDYTGYALLYGCSAQNGTQKNVWAWQLGRANQYTAAQLTAMNTTISQNADLVGAEWVNLGFTKADCDTSGAAALVAPLFLLALYNIVTKIL